MKTDSKSDIGHLLYRISKDSFKIILLQMILGETTAKILQKYDMRDWSDRFVAFANIISEYNIDVNHCLPPPPPQGRVFAMMGELQHKDPYLDNTDIVILVQVLHDPDSKFFVTPDSKLVDNPVIKDYENGLWDSGLRCKKLKITGTV